MRSLLTSMVLMTTATTVGAQEAPARYSGPKEKLHIYVLAGQSNMSGRAEIEEADRAIPKNLYLLDSSGNWTAATHPFIQYTNVPNSADEAVIKAKGKNGLNLGLAFARRMSAADPDAAIGLVVNSKGGSPIETWMKTGKGSNYDRTLARIRPIRSSGVVKGILWHQGEANLELGARYLDSLAVVIDQFRKDLADPTLPFVAGQIAPLSKDKDKIDSFNRAILELPKRVPHTGVVRGDDLSGKDIHFDSAETRKLGERYAEEMLRLQTK
jgi:Carbohydrate esterase, sialic acid-specific acetylesterase